MVSFIAPSNSLPFALHHESLLPCGTYRKDKASGYPKQVIIIKSGIVGAETRKLDFLFVNKVILLFFNKRAASDYRESNSPVKPLECK